MMADLPSTLPKTLRAAGLKVVEVPGWRGRGRPTGGFVPAGVLVHHTATGKNVKVADVLALLTNGRGGSKPLPGPLAQLGLGRDGTVYLIASGRANHAGKARTSGTVASGDGNTLYIGIEAFNDGVGEKWPDIQYNAYVLLCAVLCRKITGNSAQTVRGHKETSTTGKIDPTFDMDEFRQAVATAMAPPPPKDKPLNNVQKAHQLASEGLKKLAEANKLLEEVEDRPAVAKMATKWKAGWHIIADAKAEGPPS